MSGKNKNNNRKLNNISEYNDVGKIDRLDSIESRVDKCFSRSDYEEFQSEVEKIIDKRLGHDDARNKLNNYVDKRANDCIEARGIKEKTIQDAKITQGWTVVGVLASLIAAIAGFFIDG